MRGKLTTVAVLTVAVAACSTEGTPATTPPPTPPTSTTVATTVPPATSTTTTAATTTTLDRLEEIEAIFQDLEERRLQALYEGDREAFQALFANDGYMERSMGAFDVVGFVDEPIAELVDLVLVHDGSECLAASYGIQLGESAEASSPSVVVLERTNEEWGFSYAGEGWICDGPHPFSS